VARNEINLTKLEEVNASSGAEKEKGNEDLNTNTFIKHLPLTKKSDLKASDYPAIS
jgi:hypothetical protein